MTCNLAMELFLLLDRGETPSPELAEHLRSCPSCAAEVRQIRSAMDSFLARAGFSPGRDLSDPVMARISALEGTVHLESPAQEPRRGLEISLSNWIVSGLVILAGMMLIPYSTIPPLLFRMLGPQWELPLHLVLGLVITTYTTLFIASHLGDLRRFLKIR